MEKPAVTTEQLDGLLTITLTRPEAFNSVNQEMGSLLLEAFEQAHRMQEIRAVLLTGEGKAFCAGQDLNEVTSELNLKTVVEQRYNPLITCMFNLPKPIICAVNGTAAGAGVSLCLACDIVVAARSASFIQAFSQIGLVPDSGGTFFLPRRVGAAQALALSLLSPRLSADDAKRIGLIYEVFDDDALREESLKLAKALARGPTLGLGLTKKAIRESFNHSLEKQLLREADYQEQAGSSADFQEGLSAFREKRKPKFTGQ